jgi:hypothetical protein
MRMINITRTSEAKWKKCLYKDCDINGSVLSVIYLLISVPVFSYAVERARKTGKLVKIW